MQKSFNICQLLCGFGSCIVFSLVNNVKRADVCSMNIETSASIAKLNETSFIQIATLLWSLRD